MWKDSLCQLRCRLHTASNGSPKQHHPGGRHPGNCILGILNFLVVLTAVSESNLMMVVFMVFKILKHLELRKMLFPSSLYYTLYAEERFRIIEKASTCAFRHALLHLYAGIFRAIFEAFLTIFSWSVSLRVFLVSSKEVVGVWLHLKTQQLNELYNSNMFKQLCSLCTFSLSLWLNPGWVLDTRHVSPFFISFGWFWSSRALSALNRNTLDKIMTNWHSLLGALGANLVQKHSQGILWLCLRGTKRQQRWSTSSAAGPSGSCAAGCGRGSVILNMCSTILTNS